jgi:hypothetical protein
MKTKLIWLIALVIGLTLTSCEKDDKESSEVEEPKTEENKILDTSSSSKLCSSEYTLTAMLPEVITNEMKEKHKLIPLNYGQAWNFISSTNPNVSFSVFRKDTQTIVRGYLHWINSSDITKALAIRWIVYTTNCGVYLLGYNDDFDFECSSEHYKKFAVCYKMSVNEQGKLVLTPHIKGQLYPDCYDNRYEPIETFFVAFTQQ